ALSPALTPYAQQLDDGPEIFAGRRQPVEMALAAGLRLDMDDARLLKLLETLNQHCPRYRGRGLKQFSEGPGAEAQLPYDDRSPAVAKDFGGLDDGAELSARGHSALILRLELRRKYGIRTSCASTYSVLEGQPGCPQIGATRRVVVQHDRARSTTRGSRHVATTQRRRSGF